MRHVSLAQLHCIGRGHEARFSEDFDQTLSNTIHATPKPDRVLPLRARPS
jgi:hypothetical protein